VAQNKKKRTNSRKKVVQFKKKRTNSRKKVTKIEKKRTNSSKNEKKVTENQKKSNIPGARATNFAFFCSKTPFFHRKPVFFDQFTPKKSLKKIEYSKSTTTMQTKRLQWLLNLALFKIRSQRSRVCLCCSRVCLCCSRRVLKVGNLPFSTFLTPLRNVKFSLIKGWLKSPPLSRSSLRGRPSQLGKSASHYLGKFQKFQKSWLLGQQKKSIS